MIGQRVDPLVQCRVEHCHDLLLPVRTHKAKEKLRLVDRILWDAMSTEDWKLIDT
jgi:hypothetical protein